MANITFLDAPGRMYDLFFLFILNFNKDLCLLDTPTRHKAPDEVAYYTQLLESYPPISEKLRVFFQVNDAGKCFMTRFYFDNYKSSMLRGEYDLAFVRKELSNLDQVKDNVLTHYFPSLNDEEKAACKSSVSSINQIINTSDISSDLKVSLYNFFIDADNVLLTLRDELLQKSFIQELECSRNYSMYQSLRERFDFSLVEKALSHSKVGEVDFPICSRVHVTFCTYVKGIVHYCLVENELFVMLGSNYTDVLSSLQNGEMYPDLKNFGQAISDSNRVAILELIYKRGEVTAKEVEQEMNLPAPNAYYHLSLMIKAGVLSSSNVGKTVYYSINSLYFKTLAEIILHFSKGGKIEI